MSRPVPRRQLCVAWTCVKCDVSGLDPKPDDGTMPPCWNCGGEVKVIAQPTMPVIS